MLLDRLLDAPADRVARLHVQVPVDIDGQVHECLLARLAGTHVLHVDHFRHAGDDVLDLFSPLRRRPVKQHARRLTRDAQHHAQDDDEDEAGGGDIDQE